jgi:beta-galactosidase
VATRNGDQKNMVSFSSKEREAFNGLALVVVRSLAGNSGKITVKAKSPGLKESNIRITSK